MSSASATPFFVYILRCADGSLYVGHTHDVQKRVRTHNEGRGAQWTARRLPVQLAYQERLISEEQAMSRERQIKRWSQAKKLALVNNDLTSLHELTKRRVP